VKLSKKSLSLSNLVYVYAENWLMIQGKPNSLRVLCCFDKSSAL